MRNKFHLTGILLLLFFTNLLSQKQNEISFMYGFVGNDLVRAPLDGDASYDNEDVSKFGVKFQRIIKNNLSWETGFMYMKATVKTSFDIDGKPAPEHTKLEDMKVISIPFFLNQELWDYFFINGGPILHFQTEDKDFDTQSGIGFGIGIGAKYQMNNFVIYANPNFKIHTVIPFHNEKDLQRLIEGGINIGIGYKF